MTNRRSQYQPYSNHSRDSADEIYNLAAQSHVHISFDAPKYTASPLRGEIFVTHDLNLRNSDTNRDDELFGLDELPNASDRSTHLDIALLVLPTHGLTPREFYVT